MKATIASKNTIDSDNWRISTGKKEQIFSVDQVIDAYESGLSEGMAITKEIRDKIKQNIELVRKNGESFFKEINTGSKKCHSIFLKPRWYDSYDLIYVLGSLYYQDDNTSKIIYKKSWKYEDKLRGDGICVNISFIPQSENINLARLRSDGYYCYYGKLQYTITNTIEMIRKRREIT